MRKQTEKRKFFDQETRIEILKKSGDRCAHCGKPLTEKNATIDHVIPLSKGGTNETKNLVALCHECNYTKGNEVINPSRYYKYLSPEYIQEFITNHDEYCEDVSWLTTKNYTQEDRMEFKYLTKSNPLIGHRIKKGQFVTAACLKATAILYKAKYEDLDEVKDYLCKYHKKFDLETEYLDKVISDVFNRGCIYILKRGFEILAIFPVSIQKRNILSDQQESYVLCYSGLPVFYQKRDYIPLIDECISEINRGVVLANGKNIVVYEITHPLNDEYIRDFVEEMAKYGYSQRVEDDGWINTLLCQRWESFEGELEGKDFDPNEDTKYFSSTLERIMGLKPIRDTSSVHNDIQLRRKNYKKTCNNAKSLKKERKRMDREMIDEYDERYYM